MKDNPQALRWNESAQYWEKHRDVIRTMFSPITDTLIVEAGVVPGNTVLDVGTGPGEPALSVAQFVGPEGRVVGIDPTAEMIEAAGRAAARSGREVRGCRWDRRPRSLLLSRGRRSACPTPTDRPLR